MNPDNAFNRVSFSNCFRYFLLFVVCVSIYSNSSNASWHLDDYSNIINNPAIRISDLSPDSLFRAAGLFQNPNAIHTGIQFRPIAFLTFSINWYVGNDQPDGYHVVNIFLHTLCAVALFLMLQSLFLTPNLSGYCKEDEQNIALLTAVLWAIHPIQTQAVTYIVQRMTLLATLFYVSGLLCYVQARIQTERTARFGLFSGCILCLLLALGSKENAVIFPLSLALIEIVFFKNLSIGTHRKNCFCIIIAAIITTGILSAFVAYSTMPDPFTFINRMSAVRPFTMTERLLTEPRVVIGYLSQIFYPLLTRFSIEHSVTVSTSLLEPITTLASIVLISALLALSLFQLRKRPILSFSILFYFLNHIIESTVIPLELVFEHRNHLPSAFIFFPIATAGIRGLRYYQRMRRQPMFLLCFALIAGLLIVLGVTTHMRNQVWASEKTLWEDAMLKAPLSARPYGRLAWYYEGKGRYNEALSLYEASLSKQWTNPSSAAITLVNMARIYTSQQNYEKALELYDSSIATNPAYIQALYDKAQVLTTLGKRDQAKEVVTSLLSKEMPTWNDLNLMGFILLKQGLAEDALEYFRNANRLSFQNPMIFVNIGSTFSMMGQYRKANWFLKQANQMAKENIIPLLCLLDNHIKAGNIDDLNTDVNELFNNFRLEYIQDTLQQLSISKSMVPISSRAISIFIAESLRFRSDALLRRE
jgi:tetratricopeptide (TPR) repeat protein